MISLGWAILSSLICKVPDVSDYENGEPDIIDNPALKETLEFLKATMDNDIASVVDVWGDMPAR